MNDAWLFCRVASICAASLRNPSGQPSGNAIVQKDTVPGTMTSSACGMTLARSYADFVGQTCDQQDLTVSCGFGTTIAKPEATIAHQVVSPLHDRCRNVFQLVRVVEQESLLRMSIPNTLLHETQKIKNLQVLHGTESKNPAFTK